MIEDQEAEYETILIAILARMILVRARRSFVFELLPIDFQCSSCLS